MVRVFKPLRGYLQVGAKYHALLSLKWDGSGFQRVAIPDYKISIFEMAFRE